MYTNAPAELRRGVAVKKRLSFLAKPCIIGNYEVSAVATKKIAEIRDVLSPVFDRYGVTRAVLFGSVAKGTATEKSDIDLLVDSGLHGLRFVGLMESIRQAVDMPVDVFDTTHIEAGSRIDRDIRATGVTIYNGYIDGETL